MTVPEAARLLEVTPALVYKLCGAGRLAHRRIGLGRGTIRITDDDLAAYLESVKVEATPASSSIDRPRALPMRRPVVPDIVGEILRKRAARQAKS